MQWTHYKLAVLIHKTTTMNREHGTTSAYLADKLYQPVDYEARRRMRSIHLIVVSDRLTHTAINRRRLRFSSRRYTCLEWSATGRQVGAFSTCLVQASEVSSLQALFPLTDRTVVVPTR